MHKFEDVGPRIVLPKQLGRVCNVLVALLEPGGITGMNLKNPCFQFALVDLMCIFDCKL